VQKRGTTNNPIGGGEAANIKEERKKTCDGKGDKVLGKEKNGGYARGILNQKNPWRRMWKPKAALQVLAISRDLSTQEEKQCNWVTGDLNGSGQGKLDYLSLKDGLRGRK